MQIVMNWNPPTILDAGSGMGKWGILFREYLEVWQGWLHKKDWKHTIDACEIYAPYIEAARPIYDYAYDTIYTRDVMDMNLGKYDMVFLGDVIEHLPKEDGKALLARAENYLVVTPLYNTGQEVSFGNEHEAHVSTWEPIDFDHTMGVGGRFLIGWRHYG
jgi:hypothetical protein